MVGAGLARFFIFSRGHKPKMLRVRPKQVFVAATMTDKPPRVCSNALASYAKRLSRSIKLDHKFNVFGFVPKPRANISGYLWRSCLSATWLDIDTILASRIRSPSTTVLQRPFVT